MSCQHESQCAVSVTSQTKKNTSGFYDSVTSYFDVLCDLCFILFWNAPKRIHNTVSKTSCIVHRVPG